MAEPRVEIARALQAHLTPQQIDKLIDEVLAIEKRKSAEFTCRKCGQRQMQWTNINDARAVTTALSDLMAQAYGRPQEASEKMEPVQFYRLTNMEEADALRLVEEEWGGQPEQHSENGVMRTEPDAEEGLLETESDPDLQEQHPEVPNALRRCVACGELKPKVMFLPSRRGAQVCVDCRA